MSFFILFVLTFEKSVIRSVIMRNKKTSEDILDRIFFITERIVIFDDLDDVFQHIVKTSVQLTRADASTIRIFNVKTGKLELVNSYVPSQGTLTQPPIKVGEGVTGRVVMEEKPFLAADITETSHFFRKEIAKLEGVKAVMSLPLLTRAGAIGCITVYRKTREAFSDHDQLLLGIFASQIVEAVEKTQMIGELKKQAMFDTLTSVYNKNALLKILEKEIGLALRHGYETSVIFIDLDNFKQFNDQHGHLLGDKLLTDFIGIIKQCCRKTDIVGRFGGEEFVVIVPHTNKKGAVIFAKKLCDMTRRFNFIGRKGDAHITFSAGISSAPEDGKDSKEVLKKADDAMYMCKKAGKDKVAAWQKRWKNKSDQKRCGYGDKEIRGAL